MLELLEEREKQVKGEGLPELPNASAEKVVGAWPQFKWVVIITASNIINENTYMRKLIRL